MISPFFALTSGLVGDEILVQGLGESMSHNIYVESMW